jgi:hypothetical protein
VRDSCEIRRVGLVGEGLCSRGDSHRLAIPCWAGAFVFMLELMASAVVALLVAVTAVIALGLDGLEARGRRSTESRALPR